MREDLEEGEHFNALQERKEDPKTIIAEINDMEPVDFLPLQTSNHMLYSRMMVSGYVMKKVQNQNAGPLQIQFHKRKLVLDFDIFPSLTIAIGENKLVEK